MRPARLELERSTREVLDVVHVVNNTVAKVRTGRTQSAWALRTGAVGVAAGLLVFPLLAAFVPGGSYLAALGVGTTDRWSAGAALLQAANPAGSATLAIAIRLIGANAEGLQACADAARKTRKEQRCAVTVAVPER